MNNQEILEKAMRLAIDGGWRPFPVHGNVKDYKKWFFSTYRTDFIEAESLIYNPNDSSEITVSIYEIIFNHDFAKALWGNALTAFEDIPKDHYGVMGPHWQYHLQQMVIAEGSIKYLGENI